ncbi:hypothetical protein ACFL67_00445 [candidate division KSB1 bacterium]
MKKALIAITITLMIIPSIIIAQSVYQGGHIPDSTQVDWTVAGLLHEPPEIPDFVWNVTDLGADIDVHGNMPFANLFEQN